MSRDEIIRAKEKMVFIVNAYALSFFFSCISDAVDIVIEFFAFRTIRVAFMRNRKGVQSCRKVNMDAIVLSSFYLNTILRVFAHSLRI